MHTHIWRMIFVQTRNHVSSKFHTILASIIGHTAKNEIFTPYVKPFILNLLCFLRSDVAALSTYGTLSHIFILVVFQIWSKLSKCS